MMPRFRTNPSSGIPVYLQLMEEVKQAVATGALRAGDQLPGIRPLAEELVVNPNLVARAYRALETEGVVDLRIDAGALVAFARECPGVSRTGRPYDIRLRVGELAGENSRLTTKIAAELADRVTRDRELEAAREVQQRLLPQEYPAIASLDYAGICRPAHGVGGDYYDFIRLSETELAIAVGDVCGKGIPAALLMAMLRAYLHSQTMYGVSTPAQIMQALNRLVCDSVAANRYATFFYARYDSSARVLHYVNAGHNPPLVFRARGSRGEVLRLDCGGPVIGLFPQCVYRQGHVTLDPDDLVVAFTDGVSEAMNAAGDEWGEAGLMQVIEARRELCSRELIDLILGAADHFAAGAPQHDDMTLVAIRVM
jgi:phosphoserine phosphatase RsbU/P